MMFLDAETEFEHMSMLHIYAIHQGWKCPSYEIKCMDYPNKPNDFSYTAVCSFKGFKYIGKQYIPTNSY